MKQKNIKEVKTLLNELLRDSDIYNKICVISYKNRISKEKGQYEYIDINFISKLSNLRYSIKYIKDNNIVFRYNYKNYMFYKEIKCNNINEVKRYLYLIA